MCFSQRSHGRLKQNLQQYKGGMRLLFGAALKSISGIQEEQSQRGRSVTYFSRVCGFTVEWCLRGRSTCCSEHWCCGDVVVVVGGGGGDNEQLL